MRFSGTIRHELELDPNDLKNLDKFLKTTGEVLEEDSYIYLEVDAEYSGYYDKGRTYGEPEDCYPPEFEIEIGTISTVSCINVEEFLSDRHIEELTDCAIEDFQDGN